MANFREVLGIDYRSLGLFRISLGIVIIWDLISRARYLTAHYTEQGVLPTGAVDVWSNEFPIHFQGMFLSGEPWFAALIFVLAGVSAVAYTIGYQTRVMAFLCWFLLCTIHVRNELINNSGDVLLVILLFWSILLPIEKKWSVDRMFQNAGYLPEKTYHFSAASIALLIQVLLMYFFTGLFKFGQTTWMDGSHLYLTFSRFEFILDPGFLIYQYESLLSFLTYFTVYLELIGPFLLLLPFFFGPLRLVLVMIFAGFQLGIALTMFVGLFSVISMIAMIPFLPGWFWDKLFMILNSKWPHLNRIRNSIAGAVSRIVAPMYPEDSAANIEPKMVQRGFNVIAGVLIIYVFAINLDGLHYGYYTPHGFQYPSKFLKLDQRWGMFVNPVNEGRWFVGEAVLENGSKADLIRNGERYDYQANPRNITKDLQYNRWRKFLREGICHVNGDHYRSLYAEFLVNQWNQQAGEEEKVSDFKLIEYRYEIRENYDHGEPEPKILYEIKNGDG